MENCYLKGTRTCQICEKYGKCESFKEPVFDLYNNGVKVNINPMDIKELTLMQEHIKKMFKKHSKLSFYDIKKPKFEIIEVK